jgi:hypothetical protein
VNIDEIMEEHEMTADRQTMCDTSDEHTSETHVKHQEWKVIDSTENVSVQRSILKVNPKGPIQ